MAITILLQPQRRNFAFSQPGKSSEAWIKHNLRQMQNLPWLSYTRGHGVTVHAWCSDEPICAHKRSDACDMRPGMIPRLYISGSRLGLYSTLNRYQLRQMACKCRFALLEKLRKLDFHSLAQ